MRDSLDEFLASVELRAFHLVRLRLGSRDDALDVVQDSMERFVANYTERPAAEWPRLFYGILHNRVRDYQRHGQVRRRVLHQESAAEYEGESLLDRAPAPAHVGPEAETGQQDSMEALVAAIESLPARQREAVSLRVIQGLDVAETAAAMACSQGSVKTHLSRALANLREVLGDHR